MFNRNVWCGSMQIVDSDHRRSSTKPNVRLLNMLFLLLRMSRSEIDGLNMHVTLKPPHLIRTAARLPSHLVNGLQPKYVSALYQLCTRHRRGNTNPPLAAKIRVDDITGTIE